MSSWEEAAARVRAEAGIAPTAPLPVSEPALPPPAPAAAAPSLIVVDHFDLGMIEMQPQGVRLLVRPVTRLEALALVRDHRERLVVVAMNERGQGLLERELQLETSWRPKVAFGTRLLVVSQVRWNEIRWHLVEYECDGDGCVP